MRDDRRLLLGPMCSTFFDKRMSWVRCLDDMIPLCVPDHPLESYIWIWRLGLPPTGCWIG